MIFEYALLNISKGTCGRRQNDGQNRRPNQSMGVPYSTSFITWPRDCFDTRCFFPPAMCFLNFCWRGNCSIPKSADIGAYGIIHNTPNAGGPSLQLILGHPTNLIVGKSSDTRHVSRMLWNVWKSSQANKKHYLEKNNTIERHFTKVYFQPSESS